MKKDTRRLLDKARRAIQATETLAAAGDAEFAAGRAYYAMFYVAEALLYEQGMSFSKHAAVHSAFGKEFAKTCEMNPKFHRWLIDAFDTRLVTDYGIDAKIASRKSRH